MGLQIHHRQHLKRVTDACPSCIKDAYRFGDGKDGLIAALTLTHATQNNADPLLQGAYVIAIQVILLEVFPEKTSLVFAVYLKSIETAWLLALHLTILIINLLSDILFV